MFKAGDKTIAALEANYKKIVIEDHNNRVKLISDYCTIYNLDIHGWLETYKVYLEGKSLNCYSDMLGHILLDQSQYVTATCKTYEEEALLKSHCQTIKKDLNIEDTQTKRQK